MKLRGNLLLAAATLLACLTLMFVELRSEGTMLSGLNAATDEGDDLALRREGSEASEWYVSRGMPALGFERLASRAEKTEDNTRLAREAVQVAAAEEALYPSLSVGRSKGLARLQQPRWAKLREALGGHVPQEARAFWHRRKYQRATALFAEVLVRQRDLLLDDAGERAYTCFLYGDTLKAIGQEEAAERFFSQLGGQADYSVWEGERPSRPICDVRHPDAIPWARKARSELTPARSLFMDVRVDRRGVAVRVEMQVEREPLRVQLAQASIDEPRFGLPGAALGGMRVNDRFLGDQRPLTRSLRTQADGSLLVKVLYRFEHDDPKLWRNGPTSEEGGLPEDLPLEIMLPLWAQGVPTAVRVQGDAVEISLANPLPTEQSDHSLLWSWGPESPTEDRQARLLVQVDLGAANTAGILLPTRTPAFPRAVLGVLMSAVVLLTAVVHVLRRRERPWLADPRQNLIIEATVAGLLAPALAVVVARPLMLAVWGRQPLLALGSPSHLSATALTYWLVGLACAVILAVTRQSTWSQVLYLRRLKGIVFAGYLAVWFGLASWWQLLIVGGGIAPLVWFFWLAPADNPVLRLTSAEARAVHLQRDSLLSAAFALRDVEAAEESLTGWPGRIAGGQGSVEDFGKARAAMSALREELTGHLDGLRNTLNVREIPVTEVVLGIGPGATPLRNALAAVAFGGIPTLLITLGTGRLEAGVLVAHLGFFGLAFRGLRGSNGLEKAVSYGLALSVLTLVPEFMRMRTPISLTAALVEALLMLGVLMTAGVLMDALSTRRRWRTLLRLYDAPTVTRLFGGTAAAATAAAAGLLANGTSEVLGLLWGQVSGAFSGF